LTGVAGALLCFPILFNGLTNWDDVRYLIENPVFAGGPVSAFTQPFDHAWYPITQLVLFAVHAISGVAPLGFHLVQISIFIVACARMPQALKTFEVPAPVALAATLIWLAHPFRVESTAWAANLKDVTSLFFVVLAFALYGEGRRGASIAAFVLALLSKSMVAPLGLLFVGLEWKHKREGALLRSAPYWVPTAIISIVAAVLQLSQSDPWQVAPANPSTRLWMPLWYLQRLLWPDSPRVVYAWSRFGWDDGRAWLGVAFLGVAIAAVTARWRFRAQARWMIATFFLALVSVIGFVPMGQPVAERYTLIASIPLAIAVAGLLLHLPRPAAIAAVLALVAVESVASVRREQQWKDALSLWTANLPLAPEDFVVHYNLAGALGGASRFPEAHQQLLAAYALRPTWPGLDCLLATAQAATEKLDGQWINEVLPKICAADPDQRWLAARQLIAGKDRRGELLLEQLSMGSHTSEAASLLAAVALQRGDAKRAIGLARRAKVLDAHNELALETEAAALLAERRLDEALVITQSPVSNPGVRAALKGIRAAVLFAQGKVEEAEPLLEQSKEELRAAGRPVP
jgi:hypothetical protein